MLEPRADLRVVEGERGRIREALRELELHLREEPVLADAVDVEDTLDLRAGDERDRDERLRVDRRTGDEADARIEMRLVDEHGLTAACGPARDSLVEAKRRPHDLVRPL